MSIKQLLSRDKELETSVCGWVRTCRSSGEGFGFCNINDGSCVSGLQIVITDNSEFFHKVKTGSFIKCYGNLVLSPAKGQKYEMKLDRYELVGDVADDYPLSKTRIGLDKLRSICHLRARTNLFGSVFRIRSSLMKFIHDFYHSSGFLHLDPNIITCNECEGGAGVFQLTEQDIGKLKLNGNYDWNRDHFSKAVYLTVSSQLQLEALACSLGNVYTVNKSFRSEHSSTNKHVSEFTHLEIEMIDVSINTLMSNGEHLIKYCIGRILYECNDDLLSLNKFASKGIIKRLENIYSSEFKKISYDEAVEFLNKSKLKIKYGDDLSSEQENYITTKYDCPVFVYNWPIEIKSFYMKQLDSGLCSSFDLLMPYGIGELIGGSMREDNYDKLCSMMVKKDVSLESLKFYTDLRKYGTCPHGGFGLGFDRLLMMMTGIKNIRDVIPFPISYKKCDY